MLEAMVYRISLVLLAKSGSLNVVIVLSWLMRSARFEIEDHHDAQLHPLYPSLAGIVSLTWP